MEFTPEETAFLATLLENWEEGLVAAEEATEVDRSINTPEQLLDLMDGYHQDRVHILNIREKIGVTSDILSRD